MATLYSENPDNFDELEPHLITEFETCKSEIESAALVIFYDTCAVQHHSALPPQYQLKIYDYLKSKNAVVTVVKCVLMELAGDRHHLHSQVIQYLKAMAEYGIRIILFNESYVFGFLTDVYQSAATANEKLRYAVRNFNKATTTIRETVNNNAELKVLVNDDEIPTDKDLCESFFSLVRSNKQHKDNLGEQLIGICIYILLHLPAEPTHKFTIFTDDKGAARIISSSTRSIPADVSDKRAGIFSSAKLFQNMYDENFLANEAELKEVIEKIFPSNISVLALMEKSDLTTSEYTFTAEELAHLITLKNTIRIAF